MEFATLGRGRAGRLSGHAPVDCGIMRGRSQQRSGDPGALAGQQDARNLHVLDQADHALLVAVEGDAILAVGCVTERAKSTSIRPRRTRAFAASAALCWRRLKIGRAQWGNKACRLSSTETAGFYLAHGYAKKGRRRQIRRGVGLSDVEGPRVTLAFS